MNAKLPSTKPYLVRAIHQWCCDNSIFQFRYEPEGATEWEVL
jgi:stringent starvation protein B